LTAEQWVQLDQVLHERVLADLGGLHRVCMTSSDLSRYLAHPLVATAAVCLGDLLPITDVAQVEFADANTPAAETSALIRGYFERSNPLVGGGEESSQHAFLLAPASEAGKELADAARRVVPTLELVKVPGQADLMFCREQGFLTPEDLQRVFRSCRQAYAETSVLPTTSPHARFDFADWVPLDP
jgi:hypothetical protein